MQYGTVFAEPLRSSSIVLGLGSLTVGLSFFLRWIETAWILLSGVILILIGSLWLLSVWSKAPLREGTPCSVNRVFRVKKTLLQGAGFTLVEVLVATAILSIAAAAIFGLYSTGFLAGGMARRMNGAVALAQQRLEASSSPCVIVDEGPAAADPVFPGYRWQTKTTEVRPGLREVTATVTWQERGQVRSLSLTTLTPDARR